MQEVIYSFVIFKCYDGLYFVASSEPFAKVFTQILQLFITDGVQPTGTILAMSGETDLDEELNSIKEKALQVMARSLMISVSNTYGLTCLKRNRGTFMGIQTCLY